LACNGIGRKAFWEAIAEGRSGIRQIDRFDASTMPCRIGGQLWDFTPDDFMKKNIVRTWGRHVHQAIAAARLAIEDSEFEKAKYSPERVATGIGTSVGDPDEGFVPGYQAYLSGGYKRIPRLSSSKFSGHSATANVSIEMGFKGPAITITSGCATGLDTLEWGAEQIRRGKSDAAIVGATECPIFELSFAAGCALGILSKRNDEPAKAMRPFDKYRDGIVLSECAIVVTLEREDFARARGAQMLAAYKGYGAASEAYSPMALDPEGKGLARAISIALKDACMTPSDIDHIQAHGASLEMYDNSEVNSYKRALGDTVYRIPVSAAKSMTGQPYSVGGLVGVAAGVQTLNNGRLAPTVNLDEAAPGCDLDFVPNKSRINDVAAVLVNAMSFGGTHSSVVLGRIA